MSLPDHARGHRPRFFDDPSADAMLAMVLELAKDQWVLQSRLAALEHYVAHEVTGARVAWSDDYRLPAEAEAALAADRDAGVKRLLGVVERF